LRLLREALEQHCPPGTIPNSEHLAPTFMAEAEALLKGIDALAAAIPRSPKALTLPLHRGRGRAEAPARPLSGNESTPRSAAYFLRWRRRRAICLATHALA